jgi:hypothetical protein
LGLVRALRGRGGGYLLIRPGKLGAMRQLYPMLAMEGLQIGAVQALVWAFGKAKLCLAIKQVAAWPRAQRLAWAEQSLAQLDATSEPRRWVRLQRDIAHIADDQMINSFNDALLAYLARSGPTPGNVESISKTLAKAERGLVLSLAAGALGEAQRFLTMGQDALDVLAGSPIAKSDRAQHTS